MDDLIRRKDIIDSLAEYMDAFYNENGKMMYSDHILNEADCEDLKKWIMSFPSIQPEQKTGHWEDYGYNLSDSFIYEGVRCSVCKKQALRINRNDSWISRDKFHLTTYCPNCGAKMIEPQESEE